MSVARVGGIYRHYKNNKLYHVISLSTHTETEELHVTYRALDGSMSFHGVRDWTRPAVMFGEKVKHEGKEVDRFIYEGKV